MSIKKHIKWLLPLAVLVISIKPVVFTRNLVLANYHLRENKAKAAEYIYKTLRHKPSVYTVFKMYRQAGVNDLVAKKALYTMYRDNINIFNRFEEDSKVLTLSRFQRLYRDNFYFRYVFPAKTAVKGNWQNLDAVAFGLMADSGMNALTLPAWKQMTGENDFGPEFLRNLRDFYRWKGNLQMAGFLEKKHNLAKSPVRSEGPGETASLKRLTAILTETHGLTAADMGKNLLEAAAFDNEDLFEKNWYFSKMAEREPFADGSFTMGLDSTAKNSCLRLMGFYVGNREGKSNARAGVWSRETVPLRKGFYVFGFDYFTKTGWEVPSFFLWKDIKEQWLPSTAGKWKKAVYIIKNLSEKRRILKPLIRMWGTGTLWIDNVYLAGITNPGFSLPEAHGAPGAPGAGTLYIKDNE
ncbi:MAG: hypothetical protein GY950_20110 [bacterium]|nr:hypothetical protein [bacterium]